MSAITAVIAGLRRSDRTADLPDLPADKQYVTSPDPESALLKLTADPRTQAYNDALDVACDAYGTRVWKVQPKDGAR